MRLLFTPCANRGRKQGTLCRAEHNQPWSPRAGRSGNCGPSGSRCCACSLTLVAEHVGSTAWVTTLAEPDLLTKGAAAAGLKAELPPLTLDLDLPAAEGKRMKTLELPQLPLGVARPAQGPTCLQVAHALWHAVQCHSTPVLDTSRALQGKPTIHVRAHCQTSRCMPAGVQLKTLRWNMLAGARDTKVQPCVTNK